MRGVELGRSGGGTGVCVQIPQYTEEGIIDLIAKFKSIGDSRKKQL